MKLKKFILFSVFTAIMCFFSLCANASTGQVNINSGYLNVRGAASTSSAVVTTLNKNSYVTLKSHSGNWWYIEYADGLFGYCYDTYIREISVEVKKVTASCLNVRAGAGTEYKIISRLYNGQTVEVISTQNGWSKICLNGVIGYVSNKYLAELTQTYQKIYLNVADYKQYDSRWSKVTLGQSGKTIYSIGCTTCCIAMCETYRQWDNIYPSSLAKTLSYTSGGALYWPINYVTDVNEDNLYLRIYNLLKSGKPVVFGSKKLSGGQHWVVITGFSGGSLSSKNFVINDPGSKTRTTLDAHLSTYPTFYKIAYYK